jgi:hypothetical protein
MICDVHGQCRDPEWCKTGGSCAQAAARQVVAEIRAERETSLLRTEVQRLRVQRAAVLALADELEEKSGGRGVRGMTAVRIRAAMGVLSNG